MPDRVVELIEYNPLVFAVNQTASVLSAPRRRASHDRRARAAAVLSTVLRKAGAICLATRLCRPSHRHTARRSRTWWFAGRCRAALSPSLKRVGEPRARQDRCRACQITKMGPGVYHMVTGQKGLVRRSRPQPTNTIQRKSAELPSANPKRQVRQPRPGSSSKTSEPVSPVSAREARIERANTA